MTDAFAGLGVIRAAQLRPVPDLEVHAVVHREATPGHRDRASAR
jgi:hypothetical protein